MFLNVRTLAKFLKRENWSVGTVRNMIQARDLLTPTDSIAPRIGEMFGSLYGRCSKCLFGDYRTDT
jgi:hypothetical protein